MNEKWINKHKPLLRLVFRIVKGETVNEISNPCKFITNNRQHFLLFLQTLVMTLWPSCKNFIQNPSPAHAYLLILINNFSNVIFKSRGQKTEKCNFLRWVASCKMCYLPVKSVCIVRTVVGSWFINLRWFIGKSFLSHRYLFNVKWVEKNKK